MIQICLIALVGVFLSLLIKDKNPSIALLLSVACGVMIFISIVGDLSEIISFAGDFSSGFSSGEEIFSFTFKSHGDRVSCGFFSRYLSGRGRERHREKVRTCRKDNDNGSFFTGCYFAFRKNKGCIYVKKILSVFINFSLVIFFCLLPALNSGAVSVDSENVINSVSDALIPEDIESVPDESYKNAQIFGEDLSFENTSSFFDVGKIVSFIFGILTSVLAAKKSYIITLISILTLSFIAQKSSDRDSRMKKLFLPSEK